jgi:hypothetical protein
VQTFIGTPTTVVTLEYHAASFNFERLDFIGLRDEFQFLGNVRTRSIAVPAAGTDTLTLIIEFIGVNAAAGIIGYLEGKLFDRIMKAISKARKHSEQTYAMEFTGIRLVYEDTEVIIGDLAQIDGRHIKSILEQIPHILSKDEYLPINRIELPIMYMKPLFQSWSIQRADDDPGHLRYGY